MVSIYRKIKISFLKRLEQAVTVGQQRRWSRYWDRSLSSALIVGANGRPAFSCDDNP